MSAPDVQEARGSTEGSGARAKGKDKTGERGEDETGGGEGEGEAALAEEGESERFQGHADLTAPSLCVEYR
jgi:hypothetical protein